MSFYTMKVALVICFSLLLVIPCVIGQPTPSSCNGTLNVNSIYTDPPILLNTTKNGKLYTTGNEGEEVFVVHVYGTPYEMGFAHGVLVKEKVVEVMGTFMSFMEEFIQPYVKFLPDFMQKIIEEFGIDAALDMEILLTEAFTPNYFFEEIQGIADGSGVDYKTILRMHMFPELIKASCSMIGGWGSASFNGGLFQVRALDWGTNNPLRLNPQLTIYHPQDGHPFAILGWSGFIGALTGYSTNVAICEKVWLRYNESSSRVGIPFHFLLRDILQYDQNITMSLNRINDARRTCSIFVGLGDHTGIFNAVEYSHEIVRVFTCNTPFPGYVPMPPEHPLFKDAVYIDKHSQPSTDPCLGDLMQNYYGHYNVTNLIDIISQLQTGDLHAAVFDFSGNSMYVSVASQNIPFPQPPGTYVAPAYERQFIKIDMNYFFNN